MDDRMLNQEAIQARLRIISLLKFSTKETEKLNFQIKNMVNKLHDKHTRKAA